MRRHSSSFSAAGALRAGCVLLCCLALGCTTPNQGPSRQQVVNQAESGQYELVMVDDRVARRLSASGRHGFSSTFRNAPVLSPGQVLGVGDRLNVSIFEAGRGGLFSTDEGNGMLNLPSITVDTDGSVTLPYTGPIQARGRTPEQMEEDIVAALSGSAIEPQAVVEIAHDAGRSVTVTGAVARPARVPLDLRGNRLSAVLVGAGGARHPPHEVQVTVTRRGQSSTASLARIEADPSQDIAMRADDLVTLRHQPESYTVMGSVVQPADVPFDEPTVSLMEAVGKSRGLQDNLADPKGVFLFRREPPPHLQALDVASKPWWSTEQGGIPTVYMLDFSNPKALFMAQSIQMRDADILYVANADVVELRRSLALFALALGITRTTQLLLE